MGTVTELAAQIGEIGKQIEKENEDFEEMVRHLARNEINRTFFTGPEKERYSYVQLKKVCEALLEELNK